MSQDIVKIQDKQNLLNDENIAKIKEAALNDSWGFFENWSGGIKEDISLLPAYFKHSVENLEDSWKGLANKVFNNNIYHIKLDSDFTETAKLFNLNADELKSLYNKDAAMNVEEWQKSDYYRDGLEFKPFWTEEVAEKKAKYFDKKKDFELQMQKGSKLSAIGGFFASFPELATPGNLAGNFIIGGGNILGKGLVKTATPLINLLSNNAIAFGLGTGADTYFISQETGEKMTIEDYAQQVVFGGALGIAFGLGHYGIAKAYNKFKTKKNLSPDELAKTTKDIYSEQQQNRNDINIDIQRERNKIDYINGNTKAIEQTPLKSNEYINQETGLVSQYPTTRINIAADYNSPLRKINGNYMVLEGDRFIDSEKQKIITSHILDGFGVSKNKNYKGVQPKDIDANGFMSIQEKGNNLEIPLVLDENIALDGGVPVVDSNGNVISGNHRTLSVLVNYKIGDKSRYKQALIDRGINIEGFNNPILVFKMDARYTEKEITEIALGANKPRTGVYSNKEKALMESTEMGSSFEFLNDNIMSLKDNENFIKSFIKNKTSEELRELIHINSNGKITLTQTALERIEAATVMKAYDNPNMITAIYTSIDDEVYKALQKSLIETAPAFARMKTKIEKGILDPMSDITNNISDAFNTLLFFKDLPPKERVAQLKTRDLFGENMNPVTESLVRLFAKNETTLDGIVSNKNASEMLQKISSFLELEGERNIFKNEFNLTEDKILQEIDKIKDTIKGKNNFISYQDLPSVILKNEDIALNKQINNIEIPQKNTIAELEQEAQFFNEQIKEKKISLDIGNNIIEKNNKVIQKAKDIAKAFEDFNLCMYGE